MYFKENKATMYVDGHYLKVDPRILDVFTPGSFKGKGVFETMLAIGTKVFDVKEHLQRLNNSFKGAKVSSSVIQEIVLRNGFDISRVRVLAWRQGHQKHVAVMALAYQFPTNESFKVCVLKTNRAANSKLAHTKSLDYKIFADAYLKAKAKGYDEALLLNQKGYVFEASRANIFVLNNDQLITPPLSSGCLNGITRQKLIKTAQKMGVPVLEKNLTVPMIKTAQERFLTNSLIGLKSFQL
jgi:branched-subunit amino acid aminotransferase/4-amino-4-deoxychorismate lyase